MSGFAVVLSYEVNGSVIMQFLTVSSIYFTVFVPYKMYETGGLAHVKSHRGSQNLNLPRLQYKLKMNMKDNQVS